MNQQLPGRTQWNGHTCVSMSMSSVSIIYTHSCLSTTISVYLYQHLHQYLSLYRQPYTQMHSHLYAHLLSIDAVIITTVPENLLCFCSFLFPSNHLFYPFLTRMLFLPETLSSPCTFSHYIGLCPFPSSALSPKNKLTTFYFPSVMILKQCSLFLRIPTKDVLSWRWI